MGYCCVKLQQELVEERNDYYNSQTKSQMDSVDNNLMRENDPRMPLFNDRRTKVTFGNRNLTLGVKMAYPAVRWSLRTGSG